MKLNRPFVQNIAMSDLTSLKNNRIFPQIGGGEVSMDNQGQISAGPNVDSCDSAAMKKDSFGTSDVVYVEGTALPTSATIQVYVVPDVDIWVNYATFPSRVVGTATTVKTDSQGNLPATQVWGPPLIDGQYDLVLDVNGNAKYDETVDVLDDYDVSGTAGFVVPEVGSWVVLLLMFSVSVLTLLIQKRPK
jgi:hypothetical protein